MLGPIVRMLEASEQGTRSFSGTNYQAEILLGEEDGMERVIGWVDKVENTDFLPGKTVTSFFLDGVAAKSWKVSLTDQRIIVWNPASQGLIGKAKVKSGKSSGGHLRYSSITNLSAFIKEGKAVLLVVCARPQKARTAISITSDFESLREILDELYHTLDEWLKKNNRKIQDDADDPRLHKTLLAWDEFLEKAWNPEYQEVSVLVPNSRFELVGENKRSE